MPLFVPMSRFDGSTLTLSPSIVYDPDAQAWFDLMGEPLEPEVALAFNNLIVGHKSDGDWNKINLMVPLMGAPTLAGGLVPIKGNAPTPFNVPTSAYDRLTGLVGNGVDRYLDFNYPNNTDGQNDFHRAAFISENVALDAAAGIVWGSGFTSSANQLFAYNTIHNARVKTNSSTGDTTQASISGFYGHNRASSATFERVLPRGLAATVSLSSTGNSTYRSFGLGLIGTNTGDPSPVSFGLNRVAMYYAGSSVSTLATVRARVNTFVSEVASALSSPTFSPAGTTTLIVVAGQSNAAGHGGLTKANFPYTYSRVQTYKKANYLSTADDGAFELLNFGTNNVTTGTATVNDPVSFLAKFMEERTPNDIRVVKVAVGSTGFVNGTGDWAVGGGLRNALLTHYLPKAIAALKAQGRTVRVLPILWICGETDSQLEASANAYESQCTAFYSDIRAVVPGVPIVAVKVRDGINSTGQFPFFQTVRAAEEAIALSPNNYLINGDDLPLQDVVHYTHWGYHQIASRYISLSRTVGSVEA